jgi:hypothetical protein
MDFIVGFHVARGGSYDCPLCDSLVGDYPKDFTFLGWHPNCMCIATPIISDAPLGYEDQATNGVESPGKFNDWITDNEERIEAMRERGTLPWFLLENEKYFK